MYHGRLRGRCRGSCRDAHRGDTRGSYRDTWRHPWQVPRAGAAVCTRVRRGIAPRQVSPYTARRVAALHADLIPTVAAGHAVGDVPRASSRRVASIAVALAVALAVDRAATRATTLDTSPHMPRHVAKKSNNYTTLY